MPLRWRPAAESPLPARRARAEYGGRAPQAAGARRLGGLRFRPGWGCAGSMRSSRDFDRTRNVYLSERAHWSAAAFPHSDRPLPAGGCIAGRRAVRVCRRGGKIAGDSRRGPGNWLAVALAPSRWGHERRWNRRRRQKNLLAALVTFRRQAAAAIARILDSLSRAAAETNCDALASRSGFYFADNPQNIRRSPVWSS